MFAIIATITGIDKLTRPLWPETPEGNLYRQLLVHALKDHEGYVGRSYPESHVAVTEFSSEMSFTEFRKECKTLLADLFKKAIEYYEKDKGCSVEVKLSSAEKVGNDEIVRTIVLDKPGVPDSWYREVKTSNSRFIKDQKDSK